MPKTRARRRRRTIAVTVVTAMVLGIGGFLALQRGKPFLLGSGCMARVAGQALDLDAEQAAIAATIAGVGHRYGLPRAAVTVAFAAALQESHLHDFSSGDRDSVGVFQQRPSEGWGTPNQLRDPVFAATRFFGALVKVPGYARMPVYQAAQAVQHSADGTAYRQYEQAAAMLSAAFTGNAARAVWCWYQPYPAVRQARLGAAGSELKRTFGTLAEHAGTSGAAYAVDTPASVARVAAAETAVVLRASRAQTGWAIASWAVTHATVYGIRQVRYAGYAWRASSGQSGWRQDAAAPGGRVELG